ncbi:MAG: HAD family hydrolase [Myxococcaceae bacterium]|nr:HAD family hydrolase [Myxococcaceae bacterium]
MSIDCVVLDFDGTFTDVEREAAPFQRVYRQFLGELLGRDIAAMWEEEEAVITGKPSEFGWQFGGKTVAPATADPYLLSTAVTQRIFDRLGLLPTLAWRTEISQALYREAYRHSGSAFRPEAREVLEALVEAPARVYVVTNSHPEVVSRKLDLLAPRGREKVLVIGDAKKFVIDDAAPMDERFAAVPVTRSVPGLETRPVHLRRGRYYEALRGIWTELGSGPERTLVCGDIWELDLALPQELGTFVHLLERPTTLDYERQAIAAAGPRGAISTTLREVVARVREG